MRSAFCRLLLPTLISFLIAPATASGTTTPTCSVSSAPRIFAAVDERVLTTLPGNVHPLAQPQFDRGRVSDGLPMEHIILLLRRSPEQESALAARIEQMHNPNSSEYHHWLKPEDIGSCYGVSDADIGKVTGWLQSHGFTVDSVPAGKTTIIFSGTAGQVRSAFRTEIHNLDVRGESHIANMTELRVPAALAPIITGVRSLNNFFPKPNVHVVGPIQRDPQTGKWRPLDRAEARKSGGPQPDHSGVSPLITFNSGGYDYWAVGPQDFYTIYNENTLLTASAPINGAGQTLAVVQDSDVNPNDIAAFRSQFGLPAYPSPPNNQQGGVNYFNGLGSFCSDPGITDVGETEADIDLEWIGATAPAAIIDFVSCADTESTFGGDLAAEFIVNTLASSVSAFSESFGECEAQLGQSNNFYYNLWQQAAAEGQTPVMSAGDTGDDTCDFGAGGGPNGFDIGQTGISVSGLASTPYNVAVGGTDFSDNYQTNFNPTAYWNNNDSPPYGSALQYVPEISWNDTCASTILVDYVSAYYGITYSNGPEGLCNDTVNFNQPYPYTYLAGGAGGISTLYGQPSWQNGVYGVGLSGNYTSTSNRNLPDVSLFAGDGFWGHLLMFCESDAAPTGSCDFTNSDNDYVLSAGGTSFGAPQLAGIIGLINQATSSRQGQANYTFYSLASLEYGTPHNPNFSTSAPSLYSCEGSNINAIGNYSTGTFGACLFYNINRTSQVGFNSCLNGNGSGCIVDNNDQPCITGTPDCNTNHHGDSYGLLSASTSSFEVAFPQSFGYSAATGLGSFNVANLVLNWQAMAGDDMLTVSVSGQGGVSSGDGNINCPTVCNHAYVPNSLATLAAVPQPGYAFQGWSGACSGTGYCNVTMNGNLTVNANFIGIPQGYVNLSVTVAGNGTVRSTDGSINCPILCSASYPQNTQVTLNASPGSGATFGGWIGPCTGTASCTVTMTHNYSLTGEFTAPVQFVPVTPCRLVDTRSNNEPVRGGTFRDFVLPGNCNIPSSATAYSLNVTVVPNHVALGYLTIWPTGADQPLVSTLNSPDGRNKANAAIVPAGYQGAVSVFVTNTTQLILDIDGYFAPGAPNGLEFYPLAPCRVVDTRAGSMEPQGLGPPSFQAQQTRTLPILSSPCLQGISNPQAYSFNATVVPHPAGQPLGYLTLWPSNQSQPTVSTLNNPTGTVVANGAIVPAAPDGSVNAYTYNSTDLILDINGYFAAPGQNGYSLYPLAPCRVYDSRNNNGQPFSGERTVPVASSPCSPDGGGNPPAYVFNATVVPRPMLGYLTLWADGGTMPVVSTLNAYDGFITSNLAIVPNSDGKTDAFAGDGTTHLILDISGYFAH